MSSNPGVLTSLMPGANFSGSSVAVPSSPITPGGGTAAIGGGTNPFLPTSTTGTKSMPMTSPALPMPANTGGGTTSSTGLGGTNPASLLGMGSESAAQIIQGLHNAGVPHNIAMLLAGFLQSGAGFNPQVAQSLMNAMQPQIERGQENIMEQFSATGNRFGSPAAVGLGDYMGQVNLNMDQIFAQLYETSVQNYLSVLMGNKQGTPSAGDVFMNALASAGGTTLGSPNVSFGGGGPSGGFG